MFGRCFDRFGLSSAFFTFCGCTLTGRRPLSGGGTLRFGVALFCCRDTEHFLGQIDVQTVNVDGMWEPERTEQSCRFEVADMKDTLVLMSMLWDALEQHL